MKNFEQPYLSRNITEFWRRWHISLSTWLKDYLYFSLGGNRVGKFNTYKNLMITMLLGGLWHGASWNFVIWGGLHGIYLIIHKIVLKNRKIGSNNLKTFNFIDVFKILTTYLLVLLTWLFFRAKNFTDVKIFFNKIFYWEPSQYNILFLKITFAYIFLTLLLDLFEYFTKSHLFILKIKSKGIKLGILLFLFMISLIYIIQAEALPFIYFQF